MVDFDNVEIIHCDWWRS